MSYRSTDRVSTRTQNILYSVMQDIASLWPNQEDRTRYQSAATNFRIPYWDWALSPPAGESVLPKSIGGKEFVDIDGPNGEQRIANPLFSYVFKPLDSADFLNVGPVCLPPSGPSLFTANIYIVGHLDRDRPGTYEQQHHSREQ
jgi:tyrosinase-like protein